jgi:hypothetical protein
LLACVVICIKMTGYSKRADAVPLMGSVDADVDAR